MPSPNYIAGIAALSICESLLLALDDHKILPEPEIAGILKDAAAAHELAVMGEQADLHGAVEAVINEILVSSNSVRRR